MGNGVFLNDEINQETKKNDVQLDLTNFLSTNNNDTTNNNTTNDINNINNTNDINETKENLSLPANPSVNQDSDNQEEEEEENDTSSQYSSGTSFTISKNIKNVNAHSKQDDGSSYPVDLSNVEQWHPYLERFQLYGTLPPVPWVQRLLENEGSITKEMHLVHLENDIQHSEIELTNILKESEILLVDLKNTSSDAAMILGAVVTTVSTSPPDISYVTANGGGNIHVLEQCPSKNKKNQLSYNIHEKISKQLITSFEKNT